MTPIDGWPCCRKCSKRWRASGRCKPEKPNRAKAYRAEKKLREVAE